MDYCIRKLLGLTEENFITDENWLEIVTENNETVHKINGTWTNTCTSCLYCSSENVIKHSPMEHKIRIPHLFGHKTILDLKVQRFICKACHKTWVVDCPLVPKNSNISYDLECQIML
ncbi:transposase family protein [uncultured Granulicatella sp.]|uniref:transposase family protein n=1 Tax=uncultured Granulicatella sp. TaxID=316089 RepID=UPI0028EEAD3C|nr:transposase family protein [uncultured Granulicatella sp.]